MFADLPRIREGLDLLGIGWVADTRWEADDVIASLITTHLTGGFAAREVLGDDGRRVGLTVRDLVGPGNG